MVVCSCNDYVALGAAPNSRHASFLLLPTFVPDYCFEVIKATLVPRGASVYSATGTDRAMKLSCVVFGIAHSR